MALTVKHNAFVAAYLENPNATEAAVAAGYSRRTAGSQGARLLKNVDVAKALKRARELRAERVEVKSDDVLRVLLRNLNVDIGDLYDAKGRFLAVHQMPAEVRKCIQSIEVEDLWAGERGSRHVAGTVTKVKFWSKDKALELAMRHMGLLKDRVEHSVSTPLAELVLASLKTPEEK